MNVTTFVGRRKITGLKRIFSTIKNDHRTADALTYSMMAPVCVTCNFPTAETSLELRKSPVFIKTK